MNSLKAFACAALFAFLFSFALPTDAQTVTATLQGQVFDASGGGVPNAKVSAVNSETGFSRSTQTTGDGAFSLPAMPAGTYSVSAQIAGFKTEEGIITLQVGQLATLNFKLNVGAVSEKVEVQAQSEVTEPTRTQISDVITQAQIRDLPVNGRRIYRFCSTLTRCSNRRHYVWKHGRNRRARHKTFLCRAEHSLQFHRRRRRRRHFDRLRHPARDPPQESVQEFRVINTDYTTEYGRATAGIVNIITKSGTNDWHGAVYEYFRNNVLDAKSILSDPGFNVLRQNQFGAEIGGPVQKDKTFIFANYEGQRRAESPTYNSVVLGNIDAINQVKTEVYGLAPENLRTLRTANTDNGFIRVDHTFNSQNYVFARYFINDDRLTNQSPLNNGFDLPSAFKNNFIRDQSLAGGLTSTITPSWINELRMQWAHRTFDFPVVSTQPHLEVSNVFATGVNRGNPDIYKERRFEIVDNVTHTFSNHTISFGGNFDHVSTFESFPLFYPFEADFANLPAFLGTDGAAGCPVGVQCPDPFVIFFERFSTTTNPLFNEPSILGGTAVYQGGAISPEVRKQASDTLNHTYSGLYIQDKWRVNSKLTLNGGFRWEWETWPSGVLNTQWNNFDPRIGLAYNLGTKRNVVFRAGFGLFHGIIPSPLLMCQAPSCGGQSTFPGRPFENNLNASTGLFSFASSPFITNLGLSALLQQGTYPNGTPNRFVRTALWPAADFCRMPRSCGSIRTARTRTAFKRARRWNFSRSRIPC